jgi:uncharacterized membrane protein required for colicin V production
MENLKYILSAVPFVILIASVIAGKIRGFASMVIQFIMTVAGVVFAREYSSEAADFVIANFFHERFVNAISEKLIAGIAGGTAEISKILPALLTEAAKGAGLSADGLVSPETISAVSEKIALSAESMFVKPLFSCIAFVIILVLAKVIGRAFSKVADLILKLPLIRDANEGLGAVAGAILGVIVAAFSVVVMITAADFLPGTKFAGAVADAKVLAWIYEKLQLIF